MAGIEEAGDGPAVAVLGEDTLVLDGQQPAVEIDDAGAEF